MNNEIYLTKAVPEDLAEIRAFYWVLLDSSPRWEELMKWKKNVYPTDAEWSAYIAAGEMYLLRQADHLLGCAAMTGKQDEAYRAIPWESGAPDERVAVIHILAIDPQVQRQGIATRFLHLLENESAGRGRNVIRLDAVGTNVPAQRLYEKYGYRKQGVTELYYECTGWTEFVLYEYVIPETSQQNVVD